MKRIFLLLLPLLLLPVFFFITDQSGWGTNEHGTCYLDRNGNPVSGWQEIDGVSYYFNSETQALHTGWITQNNVSRYLSEGRPVSGWIALEEGTFYLKEDGSIHTGWLMEAEQWYYLNAQGNPVSGWTETEDGQFYFDESGKRISGLVQIDGTVYCLGYDGTPHTGWYEQDGKHYYANADSTLYTGWLEEDGNRYYLTEDGSAAVGKRIIDGETYFFSSTGLHFIMVNPWNPLPENYEPELVLLEEHSIDPACVADLKQMLNDCQTAGYTPKILSVYRSIHSQTLLFDQGVRKRMADGNTSLDAYDMTRQSVAIPGTSEHHLGLALDIVDAEYRELDETQENTPTQQWLMENSWKYGFIVRYPAGTTDITGITYEPWHYRYVGLEMAQEIHELGITLEEYIDMLTGDGTTCGGQRANQ